MRINLGAGGRPESGYVNVDRVALPNIDVVHDLDAGPWPFPDQVAEAIRARDVFEHLAEPVLFMTECHRILRPGGLLWIRVPHWQSSDAWTDPTHRRACTEHTFDYWLPGTVFHREHNAAYGGVSFERTGLSADNGSMIFMLRKPGQASWDQPTQAMAAYPGGAR